MRRHVNVLIASIVLVCLLAPLTGAKETAAQEQASRFESAESAIQVEAVASRGPGDGFHETFFDDGLMIKGFTERYLEEERDTLLAMIQDETITDIKVAAAIRAFRQKYLLDTFLRDKTNAVRVLLRVFNRSDSAFIQVETMHTVCLMDRYNYFEPMVPQLVLKMDHYNEAVSQAAYEAMMVIIAQGNNRAREARIVFNTLRKTLFLSRLRLARMETPDTRTRQKIDVLKWSIKVLGSQELKRLPKEVLHLL